MPPKPAAKGKAPAKKPAVRKTAAKKTAAKKTAKKAAAKAVGPPPAKVCAARSTKARPAYSVKELIEMVVARRLATRGQAAKLHKDQLCKLLNIPFVGAPAQRAVKKAAGAGPSVPVAPAEGRAPARKRGSPAALFCPPS